LNRGGARADPVGLPDGDTGDGDYIYPFFSLAGDLNHDRVVSTKVIKEVIRRS
jgi:hypothetical protein